MFYYNFAFAYISQQSMLLVFFRQAYLVENPKEIVRPLGSWSQSGIGTDKGVVAKGSFVNIVERAYFLISRVFPGGGGD